MLILTPHPGSIRTFPILKTLACYMLKFLATNSFSKAILNGFEM